MNEVGRLFRNKLRPWVVACDVHGEKHVDKSSRPGQQVYRCSVCGATRVVISTLHK